MGYLALSCAWGKNDGIGVDVHVHRICQRLHFTKKPKNPWTFLVEAARRDRTEGSTVVKQALRQLEPDVVKNLLLNHARRCKREHCPTCMKLKNRIAVVKRVKRRQELWRKFRMAARVVGVLCLWHARAANRTYLPGGAGYAAARDEFEGTGKQIASQAA